MPAPRDGHTSLLVKGKMYLFGGHGQGPKQEKPLADLWIFHFEANRWEEVKQKGGDWPSPRYSHTMTPYSDGFVVLGGQTERKDLVWFFSISSLVDSSFTQNDTDRFPMDSVQTGLVLT